MKEETLKRLLSLIEKTGDRLIITDPAGEQPFVLMGLDHYEKLVVGEWKPEAQKREAAPPQALPISTDFPDNKPPKREIPLWKAPNPTTRPQPLRPAGTSPLAKGRTTSDPLFAKEGAGGVVGREAGESFTPPTLQNAALEPEGEEQFYLEPLE